MKLDTTMMQSKTANELIDFIDDVIEQHVNDKLGGHLKYQYELIKKAQRVAKGFEKKSRVHYD